jgi:YfiH family protein
MADQLRLPLADGLTAEVRFTGVDDGDFRVLDPTPGLADRRRRLVDAEWNWIRQVHGADVVIAERAGHHQGTEADGLATTVLDCPIAVTTADCAPVILVAERGVAAVHAGWRGLVEGIVERAADQLRNIGGTPLATLLGPCISPGAYEFGAEELAQVVARYGPTCQGVTDEGQMALDVPETVGLACERAGWPRPERPACTSDPRWYSHRTRADIGRQTAVVWLTGRPLADPDPTVPLPPG